MYISEIVYCSVCTDMIGLVQGICISVNVVYYTQVCMIGNNN